MSTSSRAVFLSYASQDADAAKRICDALRAAGIEVWFDQSELRGGDAWDQKIRRQIRECALFMPVISAHTDARPEGYFRLEWKLAVDRSHLLADDHPFLFPIALGDVREATARVPDRFREVQWTHLRMEETPVELAGRVARLLDAGRVGDGPRAEGAAPGPEEKRRRRDDRPPWLRYAWSVVGLVLVVYYGFSPLWRSKHRNAEAPGVTVPKDDDEDDDAKPAHVAEKDKSLAVLAFANLSGDKDNEYFSDGVSEEVLNVLAKVPGLKVTARTSAFYFKGRSEPIAEIAHQLGVAYIVEGSVRKAGNRVRINAQLIKAADGFQVWSDDFDRELKDVFAIQDEIAGLIARNLELKLGDTAKAAVTVDPEAHQFYLQGRQALLSRTEAGFDEAEKYFLRAKSIAPRWAPVYAGLADVSRLRGFVTNNSRLFPDRSWTPELSKAKNFAEQALALDPELAAAYIAFSGIHMLHWDLPESERLIQHALQLNPNEADAYLVLGRVDAALGRMDESIAAFQRGAELNPLAPRILDNLAAELNFAGRYDEGWKVIQRAAALQPDSSQIQCYQVRLLTSLGRRDEALQAVEKLLKHPDPTEIDMRRIEAALALSRFGRQAEAEALVAQVDPKNPEHLVGLGYLGHAREALPFLSEVEFGWLEDVLWGSSFDSIRDDPRFVAFLKDAGLEEAQARATAWRIAHGVGPKVKS